MTTPDPESADNPTRLKGLLGSVAYFLVVGVVVVGVFLLVPNPVEDDVDVDPTPTTGPPDRDSVFGEEPVADAAAVILPSVVSVQAPTGLGSGVILSEDGLIVTAAHIVEGADTVRVLFLNGDQEDGEVLGIASDVDIAVIKVDRTGLQPANFSTEKPRVGQMAVAVGSPFTLESTVTAGIISAVDRTNCLPGGLCLSMVQTDAAINPGNSGGALVNRHGEVVGINISIFSQSGSSQGVGFAMPSATVIEHARGVIAGSPLKPAFLGVSGGFAEGERAGALITTVLAGTGAEAAGIRVDDIIVSFDGVAVRGIDDLAAQVRTHRPGETVELVLIRDGEEMTIQVTLGVRTDSS